MGEATLEGLTGRKVHTSTFESGRYMSHIHLVRWPDLILLAPATANTINKLSAGLGDDLVTTLFLAHDFKKPYLIAPAMNQTMFAHPSTQASLRKLAEWGVEILPTGTGALACGENGEGRMLEPAEILSVIHSALVSAPAKTEEAKNSARRVLITSGGTQEPIDGIRSITNTSTGRTGAELATWFIENGDAVTLLHAANAVLPPASPNLRLIPFTSFASLQTELKTELSTTAYDLVVHLAAVADYSLNEVETGGSIQKAPLKGKLETGDSMTLRLNRNPKLIDTLKSNSKNSKVKVVAFKLTSTHDFAERSNAVAALASHAQADFIVHNDFSEISEGSHPFSIYRPGDTSQPVDQVNGARALAEKISMVTGGLL